jgi:hypothetical protein
MKSLWKLFSLIEIIIRNPLEFCDRFDAFLTIRWEKWFSKRASYPIISAAEAIAQIIGPFRDRISMQDEIQVVEVLKREVLKRMELLKANAPFTTAHNADFSLAKLCYLVCRFMQPEIVVETGVAYGVTTTFILKALQLNDKGILHSVDLPPLGRDTDKFVGFLVPKELKDRWVLHRGASKRILPRLLPQLKEVDIFIHDSLHTYWNIKLELQLVTPYLSHFAVVIADDIQNNTAFQEWVSKSKPIMWLTFKQEKKDSVAGVAIFR